MSLEDIKARAEKQPCTNYENHACSRGDRVKLVAALEAVEQFASEMRDSEIAHDRAIGKVLRGMITGALA